MIIGLEERKVGTHRIGNDSEQFHQIIGLLNLIDIEIDNGHFTWSNRHTGTPHVSCRLDHFLILKPFILDCLSWNATVIDTLGSDQ